MALLSKADRLAIFEKERALGLTNTVEYLMSEDPDIDEADAWDDIAENIQIETDITELAQKQMAMSGALGGNAARAALAMIEKCLQLQGEPEADEVAGLKALAGPSDP